jgi:hypothetical protein
VLTDDDVTSLQLAVEAGDLSEVERIIGPQDSSFLSELQVFANHTLLMYACERSTPQVVQALLDKGVVPHELEWSENNELKSALRNDQHRQAVLAKVIDAIPADMIEDMIATDWDPDELSEGRAQSPLEMAQALDDPSCHAMLAERLKNI